MGMADMLPEQELKDLTRQLLLDRLTTAYQALVDASGEEAALRALTPYIKHAGMAMAANVRANESLPDTMEAVARALYYADDCMSNGGCTILRYEHGFVAETKDCIMSDSSGFCPSALMISIDGLCEAIDPSCEIVYSQTASKGDPYCQSVIRPKKELRPNGFDMGNCMGVLDKPKISADEMHSITCQFLGEWWNIVTKAFVDLHGRERTIGILAPYMRHSGMSAGVLMSKKFKAQKNDLETLATMIDFYGDVIGQKGEVRSSSNTVVKTITECPFSDSSIEICTQFEQISNGICEAINPRYEFWYDHMMTKGDGLCQWTIQEKTSRSTSYQDQAPDRVDDSNLAILKSRLAKGEITLAEYKELKNELMS